MKYGNRNGQSLVEVVIGLAIGAVLMGTAAFAVTTMLKTNLTSERSQFASAFTQSLADNVRSYAAGNWDDLYGLAKATSTHYFLNASGTTFIVVQGEDGMIDGDVTEGLVGEWKFDEVETSTSTTTYDATGNNNNGTLQNGTARTSLTCKIGGCVSLDGVNDYISTPTVTIGSEGTISLWVKLNATTTAINKGLIGLSTNGYFYIGASNQITIYNGTTYVATGQYLADLDWHHVVFTWSGSTYITYKDDIAGSEKTATMPTSGVVKIGAYPSGGNTVNAQFDDVRIYDRALSADEVKRVYNGGVYKRFFTIENVCRTDDASSTISGTAPCTGGDVNDISTQWVTSHAEWTTGAGTSETTLPVIITRAQNDVFRQTDWSGGAADEGAVAEPTSKYSSSTNASTTGGRIQIQNLAQ